MLFAAAIFALIATGGGLVSCTTLMQWRDDSTKVIAGSLFKGQACIGEYEISGAGYVVPSIRVESDSGKTSQLALDLSECHMFGQKNETGWHAVCGNNTSAQFNLDYTDKGSSVIHVDTSTEMIEDDCYLSSVTYNSTFVLCKSSNSNSVLYYSDSVNNKSNKYPLWIQNITSLIAVDRQSAIVKSGSSVITVISFFDSVIVSTVALEKDIQIQTVNACNDYLVLIYINNGDLLFMAYNMTKLIENGRLVESNLGSVPFLLQSKAYREIWIGNIVFSVDPWAHDTKFFIPVANSSFVAIYKINMNATPIVENSFDLAPYVLLQVFGFTQFLDNGETSDELTLIAFVEDTKKRKLLIHCSARYNTIDASVLINLPAVSGTFIQKDTDHNYKFKAFIITEDKRYLVKDIKRPQFNIRHDFTERSSKRLINDVVKMAYRAGDVLQIVNWELMTILTLKGIAETASRTLFDIFPGTTNSIGLDDYSCTDITTDFVVSTTKDDTLANVSYDTLLQVKQPTLKKDISKVFSIGSGMFVLNTTTGFTLMSCTNPLSSVRCIKIFEKSLTKNTILRSAGLINDTLVLVASFELKTSITIYSLDGRVKEQYSIDYDLGVHSLIVNGAKMLLFFVNGSKISYLSVLQRTIMQGYELPNSICPTKISWGLSQQVYLNIRSECVNGRSSLLRFYLRKSEGTQKSDLILINSISPAWSKGNTMFCSSGSSVVMISRIAHKATLVSYSQDQSTEKLRDLPLKLFNVSQIVDFECVLEEPYVVLLVKDFEGLYFLISFNLINTKPWQRIHSILPVNSENPSIVKIGLTQGSSKAIALLFSNSGNIDAFEYTFSAPRLKISMPYDSKESIQNLTISMKGNMSKTVSQLSVSVIDNSQIDIKIPNFEKTKISRSVDLESLLNIHQPILAAKILGDTRGQAVVRPRLEDIGELLPDGHPSFKGIKANGKTAIGWSETILQVFENSRLTYEQQFNDIMKVILIANSSSMKLHPVAVMVMHKLADMSVAYSLLIKNDAWQTISLSIDVVYENMCGIFYWSERYKAAIVHLIGHMSQTRVAHESLVILSKVNSRLPVSPLYKTLEHTRVIYTFDNRVLALSCIYKDDRPVGLIAMVNSRVFWLVQPTEPFVQETTTSRSVFLPKKIGALAYARLGCYSEDQIEKYICNLATNQVNNWMIQIELNANISNSKVKIRRKLQNVPEFIPAKSIVTANYTAIYAVNKKEFDLYDENNEQADHGRSAADSAYAGKPSDDRYTPRALIGERWLLLVYRADQQVATPFVMLGSRQMQRLSAAKLQSIYFAVEVDKCHTNIVVNMRFDNKSIIRRYRLQNMTLEINDPGKINLRTTKLILKGMNREEEVSLHDIFRPNIWRLVAIWVLYILLGIGVYIGGMWIMKNHILVNKEKIKLSKKKISRTLGTEQVTNKNKRRLSDMESPIRFLSQTEELLD